MHIHSKNKYVFPALITCFSLVIVLLGSSFFLKISPKDLLTNIFTAPYSPHINIFLPPMIGGVNLNILIYAALFCCCLLTFLLWIMLRKSQLDFLYVLFSSVCLIYILVTTLGMKNWVLYTRNQAKALSGKTTEQKYLMFHNRPIYILAQYCKTVLPDDTSAQFITDLNLKRDPGMGNHRTLAYFLYPIDMRGIRGKETNAIIAFAKHNAKESVPEDFEILVTLDEQNLIAVKKKE